MYTTKSRYVRYHNTVTYIRYHPLKTMVQYITHFKGGILLTSDKMKGYYDCKSIILSKEVHVFFFLFGNAFEYHASTNILDKKYYSY